MIKLPEIDKDMHPENMTRQLSIILEAKEPSVGDSTKKQDVVKSRIPTVVNSVEKLMEV